ncbi:LysR family transcriptional regulator [Nitrincola tapanii]|uniref:LysR family transcriptional regulator n=1 Tax=Nitrincola tapanii TaxID=1708751 RepID=A0A5A9W570_9GAMM|nr:LysR family transcriptional regulator [Nitrincola tapanii]KAA0875683.1 LysR family transcriptional regulator [Nitrincola tapanii]
MRISLEQWQAFIAIVDQGGYAQAAETLRKSQSAITYSIQRLEQELDLKVFRIEGRRSVLTDAGEALLRQARQLLQQADQIETLAQGFAAGWEAEIRIAMDSLFPAQWMLDALATFALEQPQIRITLSETVLSGTDEALLKHEADLVISGRVPPGFVGDPLCTVRFIAVAHPEHPLHQLPTPLDTRDLRQHRQLVVKDSGTRRLDAGWLGADQRWTLSSARTSIEAACRGLGFAWYPHTHIQEALSQGLLKPLPLATGAERWVPLYLVISQPNHPGPGIRRLAELLQARTRDPSLN